MITESIIRSLEGVPALDRIGRWLANSFARFVRPGPVKDLLSGTPMRHPAHPMLTDVTIGAWTSAVLLDVAGYPRGAEALIGLGALSAAPTALTGLNDLGDITDRPTRAVGVAHALGNVTALGLFFASYIARRKRAHHTGVVLSWLGFGALTASGFLGGDLAYRRGVGVDQTIFERGVSGWTAVASSDELSDAKAIRVTVEGTDVMLYRTEGRIDALGNRCSHRGGPLHKGKVADGCVTCPWHLSTFRLEDGEILRGPATAPQRTFDVREHDGKLEIRSR